MNIYTLNMVQMQAHVYTFMRCRLKVCENSTTTIIINGISNLRHYKYLEENNLIIRFTKI